VLGHGARYNREPAWKETVVGLGVGNGVIEQEYTSLAQVQQPSVSRRTYHEVLS